MQKKSGLEEMAEEELVDLARRGGRDAFSELIRRNYGRSFKLAISILRNRDDAEDEVQNACGKAFQHIGQFNRDARFSTWMARIVVNQCLMRLRRGRRATFLYIDDAQIGEDRGTFELMDEGRTPEALLGAKELGAVLEREIRRIPPLLRNVLMLRDMRELPMAEVAERLGISEAAARSRLLRARAELRSRLGKQCGRSGHATLTA